MNTNTIIVLAGIGVAIYFLTRDSGGGGSTASAATADDKGSGSGTINAPTLSNAVDAFGEFLGRIGARRVEPAGTIGGSYGAPAPYPAQLSAIRFGATTAPRFFSRA